MATISTKGQRPATINNKLSTLLDKNVNYSPVVVELVTEIKESSNPKTKMLGAILLFPSVAKNAQGEMEDRKHWVSFDNLFTTSKDLFNKFYDNTTSEFINACKVGVKGGQVFLANA